MQSTLTSSIITSVTKSSVAKCTLNTARRRTCGRHNDKETARTAPQGYERRLVDVVTAFLYGGMKKVVYYVASEGVELDKYFDCLELFKAIYGLKQASHVWNGTFDEFVCLIGFQVSAFDPCLYIKNIEGHCVLLLVYVDDVLVTGSSTELIARTKTALKVRFEMSDSG